MRGVAYNMLRGDLGAECDRLVRRGVSYGRSVCVWALISESERGLREW